MTGPSVLRRTYLWTLSLFSTALLSGCASALKTKGSDLPKASEPHVHSVAGTFSAASTVLQRSEATATTATQLPQKFTRSGRFSVVFSPNASSVPQAEGMNGSNSEFQNIFASFDFNGNVQSGSLALTSPLGTQLGVARWGISAPTTAATVNPVTNGADTTALSRDASLQQANGQTYLFTNADDLLYAVTRLPLPFATLVQWLQSARPSGGAQTNLLPAALPAPWRIDASRYAQGRVVAMHPGITNNPAQGTAATPPFVLTLVVAQDD